MRQYLIDTYIKIDSWFNDYEGIYPSKIELEIRSAAKDSLWNIMTDAERAAAGAPRVECALCKVDHGRSATGDPTQGAGCAATIAHGPDNVLYLTCHYGSQRDGAAYEVRPAAPGHAAPDAAPADPVCDGCVQVFEDCGMLTLVGNFLCEEGVAKRVFFKKEEGTE